MACTAFPKCHGTMANPIPEENDRNAQMRTIIGFIHDNTTSNHESDGHMLFLEKTEEEAYHAKKMDSTT